MLGSLVLLARLDAGSTPVAPSPAGHPSPPVPADAAQPQPDPEPSVESDEPLVEPVPAEEELPVEDPAEPDYSGMTEWELEAEADRMAEEGKADLERSRDAEVEARMAEICASEPSAPFC